MFSIMKLLLNFICVNLYIVCTTKYLVSHCLNHHRLSPYSIPFSPPQRPLNPHLPLRHLIKMHSAPLAPRPSPNRYRPPPLRSHWHYYLLPSFVKTIDYLRLVGFDFTVPVGSAAVRDRR